MTKEVILHFTEEDKKLLSTPLPDDPCKKCGDRYGCCGCIDGTKYNEAKKPYIDNNIFAIAMKLKERSNLQKEKDEIEKKIAEIENELPDFLR